MFVKLACLSMPVIYLEAGFIHTLVFSFRARLYVLKYIFILVFFKVYIALYCL